MASNISQINDAIQGLTLNFTNINTTSIFSEAIQHTNNQTNGWAGIFILIMMSISTLLYIIRNRQKFQTFTDQEVYLFGGSVVIDIVTFLFVFQILESYIIVVNLIVIYFILAFFSLLYKETNSPEV